MLIVIMTIIIETIDLSYTYKHFTNHRQEIFEECSPESYKNFWNISQIILSIFHTYIKCNNVIYLDLALLHWLIYFS